MGTIDALEPGGEAYAAACATFNLLAAAAPAVATVATSVTDVRAAVAHAREHGLKVAFVATGHRAIALPPLHDTLLIRTAIDEPVVVDPDARTARVPAGAIWRDVLPKLTPHGLTALHGTSPEVGVVGYTVGGGVGYYARPHGLMCNSVRAFDVVTADGEARRVDANNDPDLFWALRGGGGCFAAVTAVEFDLLPISTVYGGAMFWPAKHAPELLHAWLEICADAPDELTTTYRLLQLPPLPSIPEPIQGIPVVGLHGTFLGDAAEGERLLAPMRAVAATIIDDWAERPAADMARVSMDPDVALPYMASGTMLGDLDEGFVDALVEVAGEKSQSPLVALEMRQLQGALAVAKPGAGATATLPGAFTLLGIGVPVTPEIGEAVERRLEMLLEAAAPWSIARTYMNFDEVPSSARQCFDDETYDRLCAVRGAYDPDGLFVGTHHVEPVR